MSQATLITGGNIGDSRAALALARELVEVGIGRIVAQSSVHSSRAWGFDGDDFVNQVLVVETLLTPMELLEATQAIERQMGRTKKSVEGCYESRIIDIDILYYDDVVVDNERLKIPHPRIAEREFVLAPLREVRKEI